MNYYQENLLNFIVDVRNLDGKAVTKIIDGVKYPSDEIFKRLSVEEDMAIAAIDIQLNINYN